jgi:hypothetical protein
MTWIFLAPASLRTTSNSVFSSNGCRRGRAAARAGRRGRHDGRDAELLLERLDELGQLEDGHVADGVEQLFLVSHCRFFL